MNILDLPVPYLVHIVLMVSAFFLFVSAWYVVKFRRKQSSWFKKHRTINIVGLTLVLAAFVTMFGYKTYLQSGHFSNIHSIIGIIGIGFLAGTPLLSTVFRKKRALFTLHPWFGRVSLLAVPSAATLGFLYLYGVI